MCRCIRCLRCCDINSQNLVDSAKPLLRKAIQISQQTPYWHCRLLFQLAVCITSHVFLFFVLHVSWSGKTNKTSLDLIFFLLFIVVPLLLFSFFRETKDQKSQRHWLQCYLSLSATSYSGERLSVSLWPAGSWSWVCPSGWLRVYKVNVSHSSSNLLWILSS